MTTYLGLFLNNRSWTRSDGKYVKQYESHFVNKILRYRILKKKDKQIYPEYIKGNYNKKKKKRKKKHTHTHTHTQKIREIYNKLKF